MVILFYGTGIGGDLLDLVEKWLNSEFLKVAVRDVILIDELDLWCWILENFAKFSVKSFRSKVRLFQFSGFKLDGLV